MVLLELAERANAIRLEQLSPVGQSTACEAILDTIGVTLAGAREDCSRIMRAASGIAASGPASLMGTAETTSILDAALVNGTAAHALDFDDCNNTMGGHPSAPIVPALWALGERENASGQAVLEAYLTGFEVETRIGRAVNFHHYEKGWHPTATLGTFGAAAATARLLQLDVNAFANALAIAASMAAGIKANFGTMTKPAHVGLCNRNGLHAALLAAEGLSANPGALEDAQGFLDVYNGAGNFDAGKLLDGFAAPFDIEEPGVAFKRHPCCASTHPALDALLNIFAEHKIKASDIVAIRSWTHPRRLRHTNRPDPKSGLDGKFSVQYCLARAALEGVVRTDHFSDEAVRDPATRAYMTRIHAAPHPDAIMETTEHFYADIRVTMADGRVFDAHIDRPLGRDRDHPLPPGALEAKFIGCATQVVDEPTAQMMSAAILDLGALASIRAIGEMMRAGLVLQQPTPVRQRKAS